MSLWRSTRPSRTNTKKKKNILVIIGDWNAKVGSQEISGVTRKLGLKAGKRLTDFHQENALVIVNTHFQQRKRQCYTWASPKSDWLYSLQPKMEKLYTVSKNKIRSWLWLKSNLLKAKFRLNLKKAGKTTRPFRYDLNQIPYDFTVEVRNRFKGLDLIDRVPDELWNEVCDIV